MIEEPQIGMLATATGLAGVVWLVMQLVRGLMSAATFDRFAPLIAAGVGIAFSLAYVVVTTSPLTGAVLLQGVLVGLFGGLISQTINTVVTRATR